MSLCAFAALREKKSVSICVYLWLELCGFVFADGKDDSLMRW